MIDRINTRVSESVIYQRVAPVLLVCAMVIAIAAAVGTYVNDQNDRQRDRAIALANAKRIEDNTENAVTSCQNANESREASRTLWNFVLDLSQAGKPDATPQESAYLDEFRAWIDTIFQPRDCDDLSRKYPLPPPPEIPPTT